MSDPYDFFLGEVRAGNVPVDDGSRPPTPYLGDWTPLPERPAEILASVWLMCLAGPVLFATACFLLFVLALGDMFSEEPQRAGETVPLFVVAVALVPVAIALSAGLVRRQRWAAQGATVVAALIGVLTLAGLVLGDPTLWVGLVLGGTLMPIAAGVLWTPRARAWLTWTGAVPGVRSLNS